MPALGVLSSSFRPVVAEPRPRLCGVYLLILGEEIVYVGASTDLESRITQHRICSSRSAQEEERAKRGYPANVEYKPFDRVLWMALPRKVLGHYEGALIRSLCPRYNFNCPADRGHDEEILAGLGLKYAPGANWSRRERTRLARIRAR